MPNSNTHIDFKGFGDWIELFRAGEQTSSDGTTRNFTQADLDQMVANHTPAPMVVGHPKVDAPAYGWSQALKRDGDTLLGKFSDVDDAFSEMVEKKRFPNRSIRIGKNDNGWYLKHVGWLGAAAPAVEGLKPVQFNNADDEAYDFVSDAYTTSSIVRTFRRLRDFIVDKFDLETADQVIPDYTLESLEQIAADQRSEPDDSHFNQPNNGDTAVPKEYTDEQIEQIRKDAADEATAQFSSENDTLKKQLADANSAKTAIEFQAFADDLQDAGKLTPALATGFVEFMQALAAAPVELEFSQGEGDAKTAIKKSPIDWFKEFAQQLPKQVDMGESAAGGNVDTVDAAAQFNAPAGAVVDPERLALDKKAQEYARVNNVDYVEAVIAVSNG
ncbi:MAG TPA: hypothetical protein VIQ81_04085 [Gammaproteobacteria bacterium]